MATVECGRGTDLRQRCRERCLPALRRLGELWSLVCRWLWDAQRALADLDDELEAREISEARQAERVFVASVQAAMADGRITSAERARTTILARQLDAELADIAAYNEGEDEAHEKLAECVQHARQAAAKGSVALDHAEAQAGAPNGGADGVWADVRL